MSAKLTGKNQLILPKQAIDAVGPVSHVEGDRLVLTPARIGAAAAVRRKLADLGITPDDVADGLALPLRAQAEERIIQWWRGPRSGQSHSKLSTARYRPRFAGRCRPP